MLYGSLHVPTSLLPGGGFFKHGLNTDPAFIRYLLTSPLLSSTPITILDADYAHSPEYPFPAGIHDAMDTIRWVITNPKRFDSSKLTVGGFSAGASTALGAAVGIGLDIAKGESKEHPVKAVIAFYPVVDMSKIMDPTTTTLTYAAKRSPEMAKKYPGGKAPAHPGIAISPMVNKLMTDAYFLPPNPLKASTPASKLHITQSKSSPLANPLKAPVSAFPPKIALFTCQFDTLAENGEKLRDKLGNEGHGQILRGWYVEGVGHGWDKMVTKEGEKGWIEKKKAYEECADVIREVCAVKKT